MKSVISSQQLLVQLLEDNAFFDDLVDMIPSKLYVAGQSGDDYNPKYFKGQAKESKEARRAKNKQAKRAKLDPSQAETTTQIKQRLEADNSKTNKKSMVAPRPPVVAPDSGLDDDVNLTDKKRVNQSRIEALREKLRAKLEEKRGQRPSDPSSVSKRAARRAEKKRRQEEAAANKRNANKNTKKSTSNAEDKSAARHFRLDDSRHASNDPAADLAQVDFGRLAGLNPTSNSNYTETNKALRNLSKTKNLEKMLADAEAKQQRLLELQQSAAEEDRKKAADLQWGDALKEASGQRVKDDPAKIKKMLKRKVAKKQKSSKAWKARTEQTQQKMDERQKIRVHNLNKRKQGGSAGANLSKKKIATEESTAKATSPRLNRPGFEGRKLEFLNPKKKEQ